MSDFENNQSRPEESSGERAIPVAEPLPVAEPVPVADPAPVAEVPPAEEASTVGAAPIEESAPEAAPVEEPPAEEMVSYVIPKDPGMENGDQFFEININGINYRFKRGEVLTHPKGFYEFIAYKLSLRENISPEVAEFLNNSKKLN